MTNEERACANGGLLPELDGAYDRAIQIKELFLALNTLGSRTDEAFAFSTLAIKGAEMADEIISNLKEIR